SSRSARRCSRRSPPAATWSRRGSAALPSSCRPRRACSSIRSTRPRSRARSRPRRACRCRTAPRGPPRPRTTSGCRRRRWRRFSSEPLEVGEPDLDQRPDARLEAVLARDRERPLVALPDLLDRHALLQPVVARHEQVVDLRARLVLVHRRNRTAATLRAAMLAFFAVVHVLLSAALIGLVLMH